MAERIHMNEQEAEVRRRNFEEVAQGYTPEQAMTEAARCINCKNPKCVSGCPVEVPIPKFIAHIKKGEFSQAYEVIAQTNSLPAVCGRVCPQEEQCEKVCVMGIKGMSVAIGNLERFAADYEMQHPALIRQQEKPTGHKVAIIGSGPAGLTCAGELAKKGHSVTVFEAFHELGGVLVYGIPEFRLPKSIVRAEVEGLKKLGVRFETNTLVGRTVDVEELMRKEGYEAVFIGSGAGLPRFMNIPGENLVGVYSANEFLTRINLMKAYKDDSITPIKHGKKVAVVGGGNVAMDAARCALRMGAEEVRIVYRRSMEELPARKEEVKHAQEEGIIFELLTNPTEILGENGVVTGLRCIRMELGEPDESGRRSPREIPDSSFDQEADVVIMAIGTSPNPLLLKSLPEMKTQRWGGIIVDDETGKTSMDGVYAGGDAVSGAATVILAMGAGRKAAAAIDAALEQE